MMKVNEGNKQHVDFNKGEAIIATIDMSSFIQ